VGDVHGTKLLLLLRNFHRHAGKAIVPQRTGYIQLSRPFFWAGSTGIHFSKYGAGAYNGGIASWMLGISFCLQLIVDAVFLILAIRSEPEGGEQIVEMFPNRLPHHDIEASAASSDNNVKEA